MRAARAAGLQRQLAWWLDRTDVTMHLLLSNWRDAEINACTVIAAVINKGGGIRKIGSEIQIENRRDCLRSFYASEHDWGIMLDDDAVLYDKPHHNSGPALFAEMAANGISAYEGVDVFFPINPQKVGFNPIWNKDPHLFRSNHVFKRNLDLKGSMFVVRNFRKEGRAKIYPPEDFTLHGEDTAFAIEAVSKGCTVMQCQNIVLNEFTLPSHYAKKGEDRKPEMRKGNEWLAKAYRDFGLAMKQESHLLDKKEFLRRLLGNKKNAVAVPKPRMQDRFPTHLGHPH